MSKEPVEYDVAFSFLAEDETTVLAINDALAGRLTSFVYSERQLELVGEEGIEQFSRVFREQARIVVILHRPRWGQTRWTRVEENAIKVRAFDHGHDFIVMIPLEGTHALPVWYPSTLVWFDLDRYGTTGAAAVIEERVKRAGGRLKDETPEENVARLNRESAAEARRIQVREQNGTDWAAEEAGRIFARLKEVAASSSGAFAFFEEGDRNTVVRQAGLRTGRVSVAVIWYARFRNTLSESSLRVVLFSPATLRGREQTELRNREFQFDVTVGLERVWRESTENPPPRDSRPFSSSAVVKEAVSMLTDALRDAPGPDRY